MKKTTNIMQATLTIISAFIGAGFASGAEIARFFINFNILSIHFAFFISILFGLFIYINMKHNQVHTHNTALNLAEIIIFFILSSTMISGINVISKIIYPGFPIITILSIISAYIVLNMDLMKWTRISSIICIVIVLVILLNCVLNSPYKLDIASDNLTIGSITLPIIYVSMNSFSIYPLVQSLGNHTHYTREKLCITILSSSILFLLIVMVMATISVANYSTMPMLDAAHNISDLFYFIYIITLLLSIFTTFLSSFYALSQKTKIFIPSSNLNLILCFACTTLFSYIGFNNIVNIFYPIIGIIGLLFIIYQYAQYEKYKKANIK